MFKITGYLCLVVKIWDGFTSECAYRKWKWSYHSTRKWLLDFVHWTESVHITLKNSKVWYPILTLQPLNVLNANWTSYSYLYCCTVHLIDSLIITQPTNALIVCNLFLNHFFKTLSLLLHVSIAYRLSSSGSTYSS